MLLSTNSWHIATLSLQHHFCAFVGYGALYAIIVNFIMVAAGTPNTFCAG
jgi:large-conductance mechanosensitive channel